MKVYVSVPLSLVNHTWLTERGVDTNLRYETTVSKGLIPIETTRWYIDMPDKIATLYALRFS